jgi:molecular chaperone GrpE
MPKTKQDNKEPAPDTTKQEKAQASEHSKPEPKDENSKQELAGSEKLCFSDHQELIDTLQRLQAEFENYKKRVDRDYETLVKCSNEDIIKHLIPIIDNFELALKSCREKDDFYKGMELIYSQLMDTLHSQGIKLIECVGKKFDPYYHEALLTEESDKEPNTILEELQKGYMLFDKVIRHSKVKIAKKRKEEKKEEESLAGEAK